MTIEQKLLLKLEPHAKRIKEDIGNDFDYLPAVLLQLMEEQARQVKFLTDADQRLDGNLTLAFSNTQSQIEDLLQLIRETIPELIDVHTQHAIKTNDGLNAVDSQIQNSQSFISKQISEFASIHIAHATQTADRLNAVDSQIQNSQSCISKQISEFASIHVSHATQTNDKLNAIESHINAIAGDTKKAHVKLTRFLIAALTGTVLVAGLVIAVLLRH